MKGSRRHGVLWALLGALMSSKYPTPLHLSDNRALLLGSAEMNIILPKLAIPLPGPIIQFAFVVGNLDRALDHWVSLGVGPFFRRTRVQYSFARYRGETTQMDFSAALAYSGNIQIELIAQNCRSPSVYREFLDEGLEGLHHVLIAVPDLEQYRRSIAGRPLSVLGEIGHETGGVLYVRGEEQRWPLLEVGQFGERVFGLFDMLKTASETWDGTNAVRSLD